MIVADIIYLCFPNNPTGATLRHEDLEAISNLLKDKEAFKYSVDELAKFGKEVGANLVMGPDARGFIVGCPVAYAMGCGFVPVRKPGKLPRETVEESYSLEYGTNTLCVHKDAVKKGDKVLVIDDLLATGGTIEATIKFYIECGFTISAEGWYINPDTGEYDKDYDRCRC